MIPLAAQFTDNHVMMALKVKFANLRNMGVRSWPEIASWPSRLSVSFGENRPSASNDRVL